MQIRLSNPQPASDLHTTDGRYHNDCMKTFMCQKSIVAVSRKKVLDSVRSNRGFQFANKLLENNCKNMWTSVKVRGYYVESGCIVLFSRGLVVKLAERVRRRFTDSVIARVTQHTNVPNTCC